ncbi:MAG TPA: 2-phosphosulfolactate phosphatase [Bryobacteraceae bacterium]|nr:2-phosphosulfolactate phosphatase [Bryobacteraceae bacterium]
MYQPDSQAEFDLRLEWGLPGIHALAAASRAVVIVDVLSFSTSVDIAVARGAAVLPYRWRDPSAAGFAAARGAILAAKRPAGGYTYSPASLLSIQPGTALVLPSPNGSTLSLSAGPNLWTACLRNCRAVAAAVRRMGPPVAVIPAGEQWADDTLRPAAEDLLGAGAVLAELPGRLSPEAELAVAAFERFRRRLPEALAGCVSGRELIARGYPQDLDLAAEYAVSHAAPVLRGDRFVADLTVAQ